MKDKKYITINDVDGMNYLTVFTLASSIDKLIIDLQNRQQTLKNLGWKNLRFVNNSSGDYPEITMQGDRLETDSEFKNRIQAEEQQKSKNARAEEAAKIKRRQQYLKLKKEFESNDYDDK